MWPIGSGHRAGTDGYDGTADASMARLDAEFNPDDQNLGINVGEAAGQTVFHVHLHLIPRYLGDVANPRGGVRGVIPDNQNY